MEDPTLSCHQPTSPTSDLDCDPASAQQHVILSPATMVTEISASHIETADFTPNTPSTVDERDVAHPTYGFTDSNHVSSRETRSTRCRRRRLSSDGLSPSPTPLRYVVCDHPSNEPSRDSLSVGVVGAHWLISSSEVPLLLAHLKDRPHAKKRKQHNATFRIKSTNRYFTSAWRCSSSLPPFSDTPLHSGVSQSLYECS